MAFKFMLLVVAIFIINFKNAVAEEHNDCFKYDAVLPNGKKQIDIYNDCGITDSKTINPERMKCVAKTSKVVNEDGTLNKFISQVIIKMLAYPEHQDKLLKMMEDISKESPEEFYSLYPNGMAKICPKDKIYGNP